MIIKLEVQPWAKGQHLLQLTTESELDPVAWSLFNHCCEPVIDTPLQRKIIRGILEAHGAVVEFPEPTEGEST